jgi:glycosyltransferase involved in cell wall biosynthesis
LSIERIMLVPIHVKQYQGPFSIVFYLKNKEDIQKVVDLWESNQSVKNQCSFHLVFRLPQDYDSPMIKEPLLNYPVNYLRNIGRKYAKTEFILYLDADFVVSPHLYEKTNNGQIE